MIFLFNWVIFRFHEKIQGCIFVFLQILPILEKFGTLNPGICGKNCCGHCGETIYSMSLFGVNHIVNGTHIGTID